MTRHGRPGCVASMARCLNLLDVALEDTEAADELVNSHHMKLRGEPRLNERPSAGFCHRCSTERPLDEHVRAQLPGRARWLVQPTTLSRWR